MTKQKSFKRLVRTRTEKTGESSAAARAVLLAGSEGEETDAPVLTVSDEAVRNRTGKGWEEWFDLLDERGATELAHPEIVRWLTSEHDVAGWWAQSVTVSYERARGLRAVGERPDGFSAGVSKTVAVPIERLFDAFVDESMRKLWLPEGGLGLRTALRPKSARFDWGDGSSRVNVFFTAKDDAKSVAAVQHERLADAHELERMKTFWRERVATLTEVLESPDRGR